MVPGGSRRGGGHDAVGRFSTASQWRLGVEPRRARTGWRRVERPRSIAEEPRTGRGEHGAWPATLTRTAASAQQKQGREGESRESRGKRERNLIDFKFESFSKFSINTRKKFEYERCSKIQILPLLFQAGFHLRLKSKVNLKSRRTYVISRFEFELKISSTIVWKLENI